MKFQLQNKQDCYNTLYEAIPICFELMNCARSYIQQATSLENVNVDIKKQILTNLINHIGALTTRDFQLQIEDLALPVQPCIAVDGNTLLNILWNYSSHFLNILHPNYNKSDSITKMQLLEMDDIKVIHDFLNNIVIKYQIEYCFSKEEIYERIYHLQKEKEKVIMIN